ncbi:MAG TPA: GAF domain-containing protein [Mycobacteriales bacterium]|nr:GAF domain-containing protein [Mycobacteriales bacterium]
MTSAVSTLSGSVQLEGAVVTVVGEIDVLTVPILQGLLEEARTVGTGTVTVDLAGVEFIDARGLGALVQAARELSESSRPLAVLAPAKLLRLFQLTSLTQLLGVRPAGETERTVSALTTAAGTAFSLDLLDAALTVVVNMAQAVVMGADGASITLPHQGALGTVAASNDVVREMDGDQYETGEGPCLDAATLGRQVQISSLDTEERWPDFVPRARARGIRSILSTPLMGEPSVLGALNIYSRSVDAFAEHEQQLAGQFAAGAASVVARAHAGLVLKDVEAQLHQALESREVIALAQGLTMGRAGGSPAQAHAVLRGEAARAGQTLLEVCTGVVAAGGHSAPRPPAPGGEHESDTG